MEVDFRRAKRVAAGCLAMTTCAFALWLNQGQMHAATAPAASVNQTQAAQPPVAPNPAPQAPAPKDQPAAPTQPTKSNKPAAQVMDQHDQTEHGSLDQLTLNKAGQLTAQGWQATNQAQGKNYHYVIAYDPVHHQELDRQNITTTPVARPDVEKAYPGVYQSEQSGFNVTFNLGDKLNGLTQVQIISRYTDDSAGNGNAADFWFAPVTIDRQNHAWLDQVTVNNDQLQVAGWHATAAMENEPHHYLILFDRTTNQEITRIEVTNGARGDVARVLPMVPGAEQSGFSGAFKMAGVNLSHQLQLVSRYTSSADGNSHYTDYWFTLTTGQEQNQGSLDGINLSNGTDLVVYGWHASNLASLEDHQHLILYDLTANRQVGAVMGQGVARPDVAKAYPNIPGAGQSGFVGQFSLKGLNLAAGHQYVLVSRYSTNQAGNGDPGQYTDFWSTPFTLNQQGSYLDQV